MLNVFEPSKIVCDQVSAVALFARHNHKSFLISLLGKHVRISFTTHFTRVLNGHSRFNFPNLLGVLFLFIVVCYRIVCTAAPFSRLLGIKWADGNVFLKATEIRKCFCHLRFLFKIIFGEEVSCLCSTTFISQGSGKVDFSGRRMFRDATPC